MRPMCLVVTVLAAAVSGVGGCAEQEESAGAAADTTSREVPASQEGAAPGRGAAAEAAPTTLLAIMRGLEVDMNRISRALWADRYDSIAVAARAVADHPEVGPDERARILGTLGEEAPAFQQGDMRVHDEAIALAESAAAVDTAAVLRSLATLQEACVACHARFRNDLRTVAGPASPQGPGGS